MRDEPTKGKTVFLYAQICDIRFRIVFIFSNLLASLLGLLNNVGSCIFFVDIPAGLTVVSICAPSSHAPEDRDIVASCATNATGLSVLRVAELKLSLSRGAREVSDRATKLCSTRDFETPRGDSSSLSIWGFDVTSSTRERKSLMAAREDSKKCVSSVTSGRPSGQVGSEVFGCQRMLLGPLGQS